MNPVTTLRDAGFATLLNVAISPSISHHLTMNSVTTLQDAGFPTKFTVSGARVDKDVPVLFDVLLPDQINQTHVVDLVLEETGSGLVCCNSNPNLKTLDLTLLTLTSTLT
jgi:hypothetical protein